MRKPFVPRTVFVAVVTVSLVVAAVTAAQMNEPEMTTIEGSVVDMTCASKGHAMMGTWVNAKDDHMMPEGMKKACGTMCLRGLQPAGLFDGETITAVFACNSRATLSNYSGKQVEVQGFWAGEDTVKTFVPTMIRNAGSGEWEEVQCANMH
jgi:hypothetical protein